MTTDFTTFCPIFRFDMHCKTYPVRIETIHANSYVTDNEGHWVRPATFDGNMIIDPRSFYEQDAYPNIYVHQYMWDDDTIAYVYILLYLVNPGYRNGRLGFHSGDVEHTTVLVKDGVPVKVYYAAHSHTQGKWLKFDKTEHIGNHPIVYVSKGSHASYHSEGTRWRLYGVVNDISNGHGLQLEFKNEQIIPVNPETSWINGSIGDVTGPGQQDWFTRETTISVSWLSRWLGLFTCKWAKTKSPMMVKK